MKREELLKVAKPILFNTEMVRAILDGRKTVTRRLIKNYKGNLDIKPKMKIKDDVVYMEDRNYSIWEYDLKHYIKGFSKYQVGDILYVRETFMEHRTYFIKNIFDNPTILYKADYLGDEDLMNCGIDRWKPSIHMPKKYARIFLEVTDVRVERLQDITIGGCIKEGLGKYAIQSINEITKPFENLWNSTIKKDELKLYGWDANPYVFVYEFEKVEVNDG